MIAFIFWAIFFDDGVEFKQVAFISIFTFFFAFLLIQFRVETFIYTRLKDMYKKVSVLDVQDLDPDNVSTDLSQLSEEINDLAKQNRDKIQALNQQEAYRREFLGNVAHEMKTPIFTIQGYLITLLEGAGEDRELREKYLERAINGVERLETIVKDLDMIAKLETKDLNPELENFNLVDLIQKVMDMLEIKAQKRNVTLSFDQLYAFPIMVHADPEKIQQVLLNLIENSIKYGLVGGTTIIGLSETKSGEVQVNVQDNGEGISDEDKARIFERFYRVEKSRTRDEGGSGLGLSIVKHILESHKKQIEVESKVGQGTLFRFSLNKAV